MAIPSRISSLVRVLSAIVVVLLVISRLIGLCDHVVQWRLGHSAPSDSPGLSAAASDPASAGSATASAGASAAVSGAGASAAAAGASASAVGASTSAAGPPLPAWPRPARRRPRRACRPTGRSGPTGRRRSCGAGPAGDRRSVAAGRRWPRPAGPAGRRATAGRPGPRDPGRRGSPRRGAPPLTTSFGLALAKSRRALATARHVAGDEGDGRRALEQARRATRAGRRRSPADQGVLVDLVVTAGGGQRLAQRGQLGRR